MIALTLALLLGQVQLLDEGVYKGKVLGIDCVGTNISCAIDARSARLTVTGTDPGMSTPTWREYGRRVHHCSPSNIEVATTWVCNGPTVATPSASSSGMVFNLDRYYAQLISAAVSGSIVGFQNFTADHVRPGFAPLLYVDAYTGDSIVAARYWYGFSSAALGSIAVAASGPDNISFAAVAFEATYSPNYQCCTGDGADWSCSDMGLAAAASSELNVTIDLRTPSSTTCTVNGTSLTKTTNQPATGTSMSYTMTVTTTAAAAKHHLLAWFEYEQR